MMDERADIIVIIYFYNYFKRNKERERERDVYDPVREKNKDCYYSLFLFCSL